MAEITKHIDPANDLTSYTVTGKLAAEEVKQVITQFYSGQVTKLVLWDLTNADLSALHKPDIEAIAQTPRTKSQQRIQGKTALVASEDLAFGLSRMYETLTNLEHLPFETHVFRTTTDAMNWLLE
ncbi:MAG TPA: hypothetical protein VIQ03_07065 [Gammaproteobacteria bacterium]